MSHKSERRIEVIGRGVLRRGGAVLLCRNERRGYYYLPGGHVEAGELAAQAVEREFLEETGLRVECGACGFVGELIFGDKPSTHEVSIVFHVEHEGGDPPLEVQSRESKIGFAWIDLAALLDLDFRPEPIKAWLLSEEAWSAAAGVVWTSQKA